MFIKLTFETTGKEFVINVNTIASFAASVGYTCLKADGKILEVRESVEEIWRMIKEAK